MIVQPFNPNCLFDRLQEIHDRVEGAEWNITLETSIQEDVQYIATYWNCTPEQAILFSVMLFQVITNGDTSIRKLVEHLQVRPAQAMHFNALLKPLVERDWLSPRKDPSIYPYTEYSIPVSVVRATLENRPPEPIELKSYTLDEFILAFERGLNKRKNRTWSYEVFISETRSLMSAFQSNGHFQKTIQLELNEQEWSILIWALYANYIGNAILDIDDMLMVLCPNRSARYQLRQAFSEESLPLIKLGLIQCTDRETMFENYRLTDLGLKLFDSTAAIKPLHSSSPFMHIEPQKIAGKALIFDREQQGMVNKLHDMFAVDRYSELRTRLMNQGLSGGVNILLFGGPGTGKTETVYQLARSTNRMILSADASKIRSKWVGETEKNTRQLFEQYRRLMQEQPQTPILLFNEADAILGKRSNTDGRIDQMENTMQNILLEELETFDGIFMATTNLQAQLDEAFDRRFLYKLKFEKPGADVRMKLWQSKFPGMKKSFLRTLNEAFALTGAQIENIQKKMTIDQVLEPALKADLKYFQQLANQELMLIKGKEGSLRNAIGFIQTR